MGNDVAKDMIELLIDGYSREHQYARSSGQDIRDFAQYIGSPFLRAPLTDISSTQPTPGQRFLSAGGSIPELFLTYPLALQLDHFSDGRLMSNGNVLEFMNLMSRIRVPRTDPQNWIVLHSFDVGFRYQGFELAPAADVELASTGWQITDDVIDLTLPVCALMISTFIGHRMFSDAPDCTAMDVCRDEVLTRTAHAAEVTLASFFGAFEGSACNSDAFIEACASLIDRLLQDRNNFAERND